MANTNFAFPLTLRKSETQTLGGSVIGSFSLGHVFGELRPFFAFSVMANTNLAFPSTLRKLETQTLGGVGNWKFRSRTRFWGATAIFPIFHNGQHQFCISVDTQKTGDPNFRGISNWKFCSRTCFWGTMAIFPIFRNGRHQFYVSVDTQKTGDSNFRGVGYWKFHSRTRFWGAMAIFPIFRNGRHQCSNTRKTGMTFLHSKGQNGWRKFSVDSVFPLVQFPPPRLLGSFQHLGVGRHKCLKHLGMTFLHSQKVPKKVHQNRLTHLCVAVVNRLGNSTSHQKCREETDAIRLGNQTHRD